MILSALLLFLPVFLNGCATWSKHHVLPQDNNKYRIAVVPIQSDLKIRKLKYIQSLPKDFVHPPNEEMLVQELFQKAKQDMTLSLENKLNETKRFEVLPDTEVEKAISELNLSSDTRKMTKNDLARLGERLNVPVVLHISIGGYGKVKTKWLFYIFGSGGIEAITQGLAAAAITSNPWVIAGIVGEEILQETTVWGGGIYFFNRIFTPVILDARMISVFDKKLIWNETSMATINFKALKKLSKQERKRKETRLYLTSEKALEKLTKVLDAAAKRNRKGKGKENGQ